MWGNVLSEVNLPHNYHVGFSNNRSDVLIHLTQWHYWWWFWFAFAWSLYYLLILRAARLRSLKFRPRIATTTRPRGKWGDLIVCAIPISWCANIITNSQSILRMIEWQTESGALTIRIRGKQWYWIYKFELKTFTDILTLPKNIGRNNWVVYTPMDVQIADDYLHILQLRSQNKWASNYWKDSFKKAEKARDFKINNAQEVLRYNLYNQYRSNILKKYFSKNVLRHKWARSDSLEDYIALLEARYAGILEQTHQRLDDRIRNRLGSYNEYVAGVVDGSIFHARAHSYMDWLEDARSYIKLDGVGRVIERLQSKRKRMLFKEAIMGGAESRFYKKVRPWIPQAIYDDFYSLLGAETNVKNKTWGAAVKTEDSVLNTFHNGVRGALNNEDTFYSRDEQIDANDLFFENFFDTAIKKYKEVRFAVYAYNDFVDVTRWRRRPQGANAPVRIIKYPISSKADIEKHSDNIKLFGVRFHDNEPAVHKKPSPHSAFLTLKQERYKRKKKIGPRQFFIKDEFGKNTEDVKRSVKPILMHNKIIEHNYGNPTRQYRLFRKYKIRHEATNIVLSKRLLRTKRTLVLPAHISLTAITNSYDVVHSWFIPGLGLKMDCIPGRATHHTFYIDNVGFYYGQCAEICGRYHHHMPIRICALPYEHFLLWWQTFGLPRLLFSRNFRRIKQKYGHRKFIW